MSAPTFSFDGEPKLRPSTCDHCAEEHEGVTGYVLRDGDAFAVYFAEWYPHENEAWLDVILGSFAEDFLDHVTFGCRIGEIPGSDGPQCSLVPAAEVRADLPIFGTKLTREQALEHPRQPEFWALVDWLLVNDALLHDHVYRG